MKFDVGMTDTSVFTSVGFCFFKNSSYDITNYILTILINIV